MSKTVDFDSLVPGGSYQDEELYWEAGFYTDGTPVDEDELDRLAHEHSDMLYDAGLNKLIGMADFMYGD